MNKKKIISLLLALTMGLTLAGCDKNKDSSSLSENTSASSTEKLTLATPENVSVSDSGLITWTAVENATGYIVTVNGQEYTVSGTSYQVQSVDADFTYSVAATAENYNRSENSATQTFTGISNITVGIEGSAEVRSGHSVTLTATVTGTGNTAVTWEIEEGGEYAEITAGGKLTAYTTDSDRTVKVVAKSVVNSKATASKIITIKAKTQLTQAMLDALNTDTIAFNGYVNIDLWSIGLFPRLEQTYTTVVKTAMDGENWYAEYEDANTGLSSGLYYKNHNDVACQVGVSFMNEEEYAPMQDDDGRDISWTAAGLYNNFKELTAEDFTFNESSWRWEYTGSDSTLINRMVASANPYEFVPLDLSLTIEDGEIVGFRSGAADDYTLAQGYKAVQELVVAVDCGEFVEVPTISKYEFDEEIHTPLQEAIDRMQALDSYTLNYTEIVASVYATGYTMSGFVEKITPNDCYFDPYNLSYDTNGQEVRDYTGEVYGYHKIDETLYNAYAATENGYQANRAYKDSFDKAKPSFAFSAAIFTAYYKDEEEGTVTYYADDVMSAVASTFYYGVGNDIALYGLFATRGYVSETESFTPYVTVKDGYIVDAGFYFYLGMMYGVVELEYSNFGETELPQDVSFDGFETRQVPTSWNELTIINSFDSSSTEEDQEVNAAEYLATFCGSAEIAENMPFFGDALGDTYGFGLTTIYLPGGSNTSKSAVVFYYDVPLDVDYTIESSLKAVEDYLLSLGFTKNKYGEFTNGTFVVAPTDSSLDLLIYVWMN